MPPRSFFSHFLPPLLCGIILCSLVVLPVQAEAVRESAPSKAATNPTPMLPGPILVVDIKRILDESKAIIAAQRKIEIQREAFQQEIAEQESQIRTLESALQAQRDTKKTDTKRTLATPNTQPPDTQPPDTQPADVQNYAEKESQLRQKFSAVEKYVQERRKALDQATQKVMAQVQGVVMAIVTQDALQKKAQAVLIKQQVLWIAPGQDITDTVLQRLNSRLPDIAVDIAVPAAKR